MFLANGAQVEAGQTVRLGSGAKFINETKAELSQGARLKFVNLSADTQSARNDIHCQLSGENAELELYTLSLANKRSRLDLNSYIYHNVGHTKSYQLAQAVLEDSARSSFAGRLVINRHAQKSNAAQYNRNLFLSDNAEASSKPQLEVNADDVKANHGATVGRLNPLEIFYLQSRGMTREQAESMLSEGVKRGVANKLSSDFIKQKLHKFIEDAGVYSVDQ
jgi:Fe-S cluster assembly protein SufD